MMTKLLPEPARFTSPFSLRTTADDTRPSGTQADTFNVDEGRFSWFDHGNQMQWPSIQGVLSTLFLQRGLEEVFLSDFLVSGASSGLNNCFFGFSGSSVRWFRRHPLHWLDRHDSLNQPGRLISKVGNVTSRSNSTFTWDANFSRFLYLVGRTNNIKCWKWSVRELPLVTLSRLMNFSQLFVVSLTPIGLCYRFCVSRVSGIIFCWCINDHIFWSPPSSGV